MGCASSKEVTVVDTGDPAVALEQIDLAQAGAKAPATNGDNKRREGVSAGQSVEHVIDESIVHHEKTAEAYTS